MHTSIYLQPSFQIKYIFHIEKKRKPREISNKKKIICDETNTSNVLAIELVLYYIYISLSFIIIITKKKLIIISRQ